MLRTRKQLETGAEAVIVERGRSIGSTGNREKTDPLRMEQKLQSDVAAWLKERRSARRTPR